MLKIGIAEDDQKIGSLLKIALEENGFSASVFSNGIDALDNFENIPFDLLVLDILMPGLNGIQLCEKIRRHNKTVPILMLTAMGSIDDKVNGLASGADDYLVKPFHLKEFLARINALLRRNLELSIKPLNQIIYEDLSINLESKEVNRAGQLIELSAKEFDLLALFMQNPNKLLTRQYIAEKVWSINFDTGTNVIDVYVNFLRKKIEKNFDTKFIHTKINMGYIFK